MSEDNNSTRRSFLRGGALLAAPIAAAAVPAMVLAEDGAKARIERLENEAAIRELHQSWMRAFNAGERGALLEGAVLDGALPDGSVHRILADHAGAPEQIEIAADGRSAVGRFDYAVELETTLEEDCTLAQMARAQGSGTIRRTERRMLTIQYTKSGGAWKMARIGLATI